MLQQSLENGFIPTYTRSLEGVVVFSFARRFNVGALLKQVAQNRQVTLPGSIFHRGNVRAIGDANIGTGLDQESGN